MLTFAYDEIDHPDDRDRVRARGNGQDADGRFSGWLLRLCLLEPDRFRFEQTESAIRADRRFVYPIELARADLADAATAGRALSSLPAGVRDQVRRGAAAILIWLGHEAIPLELGPGGSVSLFDVIARFIEQNELTPRAVHFVTGTISALDDYAEWRHARGLYEPETFRLHAMTIFPSFAQAFYRANRGGWDIADASDDTGAVDLRRLPFSDGDARRRHPDLAEIEAERARGHVREKRLLCRLDGQELHRQVLVSYLHGWGYLAETLTSFDAAPADLNNQCAFAVPGDAAFQDRLRRSWLALQPALPLTITAETPHRLCYATVTSEAAFEGIPSVDNGVMAAILDWQPFLRLGSAEALRYLRALGFRTFERVFDERYDRRDTYAHRMMRFINAVTPIAAESRSAVRDRYFDSLPELVHNHTHLTEGRHQLHIMLQELDALLAAA